MSRKVIRKNIDWTRASCSGLDTDLFYLMRSELAVEGLTYNHLRRMCFDCPIQKECLEVATQSERYGFWGGLDEFERTYIYEGKQGRVIFRLKQDLFTIPYAVPTFEELEETVLSVTRDFGIFDGLTKKEAYSDNWG